jgi:tRNA-specific 2-thiouridylase
MIATGHYARTQDGKLLTAKNKEKDQTYFLYRVQESALQKTLFPIGEFRTKDEVRAEAKRLHLVTAQKKDSQGICFVGQVGIKDFLLHELGPQTPGPIIDQHGANVGQHEGAIFYTIGQRHGLNVGGGLPYYVVGKNLKSNEVYVTTNVQDERLWSGQVQLTDTHWINEPPQQDQVYEVRTRYRAPLVKATYHGDDIELKTEVRAITPGQSVVFYAGEQVLGGAIVA